MLKLYSFTIVRNGRFLSFFPRNEYLTVADLLRGTTVDTPDTWWYEMATTRNENPDLMKIDFLGV